MLDKVQSILLKFGDLLRVLSEIRSGNHSPATYDLAIIVVVKMTTLPNLPRKADPGG